MDTETKQKGQLVEYLGFKFEDFSQEAAILFMQKHKDLEGGATIRFTWKDLSFNITNNPIGGVINVVAENEDQVGAVGRARDLEFGLNTLRHAIEILYPTRKDEDSSIAFWKKIKKLFRV